MIAAHYPLDVGAARNHVDAMVRTWLGVPATAPVDVPQLPESLARRLLRVEEYEDRHRDQWGCFEHSFSEAYRRGCLWTPEVDAWVAEQRREIARSTTLEPLWPSGHSFAACLTHDVDMVSRQVSPDQAVRALRTALARLPTEANGPTHRLQRTARALARAAYYGVSRLPSTRDTLERCLDVEMTHGVTSSWFFTMYPSQPTPHDCVYRRDDACRFRRATATVAEVARRIADDGFEVGLHGSFLSALDARLLTEQKAALEDAVGRSVVATRQHYLRYDMRRTPRIQEQAGFRADSTLGFNRNVGFRAGTSMPFRPFDFEASAPVDVLEVPLIVQESPLLSSNALELDVALAKAVIAQLIDAVAAVGGVATLLFHPHSFLNPAFLALYRFSIEHCRARGAWFSTVGQIAEWWRDREHRLAAAAASTGHARGVRAGAW
jgi:hypothetical protein